MVYNHLSRIQCLHCIHCPELPEADVGRALLENTGTFRELFGAVFGRFGG